MYITSCAFIKDVASVVIDANKVVLWMVACDEISVVIISVMKLGTYILPHLHFSKFQTARPYLQNVEEYRAFSGVPSVQLPMP